MSNSKQTELNRRSFNRSLLLAGGAPFVGTLMGGSVCARDREASPDEKTPTELITPAGQKAIDRGLKYLVDTQVKTGRNRGAMAAGGMPAGVATASLAGLALMCGGFAPGMGPYGKVINRAVEYVLSHVRSTGYIAHPDQSRQENMYGHGFSMLFLSQAYGMTKNSEIGKKLRMAVELTCQSQNDQGGWRYKPVKSDADLSVTVCQIMGLRGARDAGIDIPDKVRKQCIEYVQKSQKSNGSFRYTIRGGHTTFAMTAAGVTSLYSAGIYEGEAIEKALSYLMRFKPNGAKQGGGHYFYSNYYAVQAMWHAGGEYWDEWFPLIRNQLIKNQQADGSWSSSRAGNPYGTAMACIILQMPLNYLPVFSP